MPDHSKYAAVEVVHTSAKKIKTVADPADNVSHTVRAIAASEAFRKYDWLRDVATLNRSGNFRGMVISARWRTVYNVVGPYAEKAGNIAFIADFAMNATEQFDEMERLWKSNDPDRGAKLSIHVSSIAARTLGGVVKSGAHLLSFSLQGYCGLAALAMGKPALDNQAVKSLRAADAYVSTTVDTVTDANNMYYAVTVNVDRLVRWGMGQ